MDYLLVYLQNYYLHLFSVCVLHFLCPPAIFNGGGEGHKVSPLSVRTSVRPVGNTFGFRAISFESIGVLD